MQQFIFAIFCTFIFGTSVTAEGSGEIDRWDWVRGTSQDVQIFLESSSFTEDFGTAGDEVFLERSEIPWLENAYLFKVKGNWEPDELRAYYLYSPGGDFISLTGSSVPIREFNAAFPPNLNDENVTAYLGFFNFFVHGESGPFLILETASNNYLPSDLISQEFSTRLLFQRHPKPIECETSQRNDWQFSCSAIVLYSDALFEADFEVDNSGGVRMVKDRLIENNLAVQAYVPIRPRDLIVAEKTVQTAENEEDEETAPASTDSQQRNLSWIFRNEEDLMTGRATPQLLSQAARVQGTQNAPVIIFECKGGVADFAIHWGVQMRARFNDSDYLAMEMLVKVGNRSPRKLLARPSPDWSVYYEMDNLGRIQSGITLGIAGMLIPSVRDYDYQWTSTSLGNSMASANELVVRATTRSGTDITALFDMSGFTEGWSNFRRAC